MRHPKVAAKVTLGWRNYYKGLDPSSREGNQAIALALLFALSCRR